MFKQAFLEYLPQGLEYESLWVLNLMDQTGSM